ncbi:MAG TPA: SLBB domain-containing protein, partial [Bacteroidota bacterium]|nr:SLBB domain-containing protein [Bacteroidota bacterium]
MKNVRMRILIRPAALLGAILLIGTVPSRGQTRGSSDDQDRNADRTRLTQEAAAQAAAMKGIALESTIDPANYYVGPSDVIAVNIWMTPPVSLVLTVTPEGTLIIPTVGEVRVADTTLAEAKVRILAEVRKRYRFAEATVTLLAPRQIVVSVTGKVLNPGSYVMSSTSRVDKAIEEANKPRVGQNAGELPSILTSSSTRNIALRHKDGRASRADITKFFATKEDRWDPYLREGDIIVVPQNFFTKNVIGIYGEVNSPGRYEYVQGDSLKDMIRIAYGFTRWANADSVELSRLDLSGSQMTSRFLDGLAIAAGRAPDVPLLPGDRIIVRGKPDRRADYTVEIIGEVEFPGVYPIARGGTRLSQVIRSAGGFTDRAFLASSVVQRRTTAASEVYLERLESLRGGVPPEDSTYYYLETDLRMRKELVDVDFERLFVKGDSSQDVILQDGDRIVITSPKTSIYVFGQVAIPGNVPFAPGADAAYYIGKAGGFTDRARTGDVKIVKAKTRQWLAPSATTIEGGDYIWVPKEIERPFGYYM